MKDRQKRRRLKTLRRCGNPIYFEYAAQHLEMELSPYAHQVPAQTEVPALNFDGYKLIPDSGRDVDWEDTGG